MDLLWPDDEGDAARKAFAIALHRLRSLLGDASSVRLRDAKLTLDTRRVRVDAWSFLGLERQANEARRRQDPAAFTRLAVHARDLYRGPFLPQDLDSPWVLSMRERLRERFVALVGRLAERYEEAGDIDEAIACYTHALAIDELAERLHQGIVRCHFHAGRAAEALNAYRRMRETLSSRLGLLPSPESEALHRQLVVSVHPASR